ncbi:MAG: hypothetical protein AAF570_23040, partial [Bacteroidota bacterium]
MAAGANDNVLVADDTYTFTDEIDVPSGVLINGLGGSWANPIASFPKTKDFDFDDLPTLEATLSLPTSFHRFFTMSAGTSDQVIGGLVMSGGHESSGGAISVTKADNVKICYNEFDGNQADLFGGAVYIVESENADILVCRFVNNSVQHDTVSQNPVIDFGKGGAVAFLKNSAMDFDTGDADLTITDSLFGEAGAGNKAEILTPRFGDGAGGGDIYQFGGKLYISGTLLQFAQAGAAIQPGDLEADRFTGDGGSLLIHAASESDYIEVKKSEFFASRSYGNGGAIYIAKNSEVPNRAMFDPDVQLGWPILVPLPDVAGGGLPGLFEEVLFDSCQGGWHAGALGANGRKVNLLIKECTFNENESGTTHLRDGKGGAVAYGGGVQRDIDPHGVVKIKLCDILKNESSGNAGGVDSTIRGLVEVENSKIHNNKAHDQLGINNGNEDTAHVAGIA